MLVYTASLLLILLVYNNNNNNDDDLTMCILLPSFPPTKNLIQHFSLFYPAHFTVFLYLKKKKKERKKIHSLNSEFYCQRVVNTVFLFQKV